MKHSQSAIKYYEKAMPMYGGLNYNRAEFIDKFGIETNDRLSNDYLWLAARVTEVKVFKNLKGCPGWELGPMDGAMRWS